MNANGDTFGIVVVTHNSGACIRACLESARPNASRIVVVDNASSDDTCGVVREFPEVALIANRTNAGFAAAVNQGVDHLATKLVLLLNPDAVLLTPVDALVAACSEPGVAAAGGKLIDEEGRPQSGFMVRRFPTPAVFCFEALGFNSIWAGNPVNRRYRCLDLDPGERRFVSQPAGAFLMFRHDAWVEARGFDESFQPLWFEDVDFLARLTALGHRVRYEPAAAARHQGAHSIASINPSQRVWYWYDNLIRYAASTSVH